MASASARLAAQYLVLAKTYDALYSHEDDEREPYKSKYEAREVLVSVWGRARTRRAAGRSSFTRPPHLPPPPCRPPSSQR